MKISMCPIDGNDEDDMFDDGYDDVADDGDVRAECV